jgi:hypothetical protein
MLQPGNQKLRTSTPLDIQYANAGGITGSGRSNLHTAGVVAD